MSKCTASTDKKYGPQDKICLKRGDNVEAKRKFLVAALSPFQTILSNFLNLVCKNYIVWLSMKTLTQMEISLHVMQHLHFSCVCISFWLQKIWYFPRSVLPCYGMSKLHTAAECEFAIISTVHKSSTSISIIKQTTT